MATRRTKIVCTIGPASRSPELIARLIDAGMDVARLNFSHGTSDEHAETIARIREAAQRAGRPIAILQDLQGPKIRTGPLQQGAPVVLNDGGFFTITTRPIVGDATIVSTTYQQLTDDVRSGDRILLADGAIELRVTQVVAQDIQCLIVHGGTLAEHQGINLPGVAVSAPALTEKDRVDLAFGIAQGVDFIALSFVRRPEDLDLARDAVRAAQAAHHFTGPLIPIIAKLEKPEAIDKLDEILARADGVMVARGDLGVEMALEEVPLIQKRIILRANALGLPVITATQMLESMIANPRPTRAEVSDVANAIFDGTDAVMLSGETAAGRYPVEATQMMARIALETETKSRLTRPAMAEHVTPAHAISLAARTLSEQPSIKLIVVFTRSGSSAHFISRDRPRVPIIALTPDDRVRLQLALWWGLTPLHADLLETTEGLIDWADRQLRELGYVQSGDQIVIMGGMPVARRASTNFVKIHTIGDVG